MNSIKTLLGMAFNPDHEDHNTYTQILSLVFLAVTGYIVIMGMLALLLGWFRG
jgi:hypothetical protein